MDFHSLYVFFFFGGKQFAYKKNCIIKIFEHILQLMLDICAVIIYYINTSYNVI